jgi:aspartate aminotransferase
MTGWRMGWMVMPRSAVAPIERLIEFNTSGGQPFLQAACVKAVTQGEDWVKWMVSRCREGRDLVLARLAGMNRVRVVPADASFYLMLQVAELSTEADSAVNFCKRLVVEGRVGLAPGTAFGAGGEGYLRLCYAQSTERLTQAMDRFETFLGKA